MRSICVYLLGPYHVTVGGEAVNEFRSDKVRALLAYLVMEPDRPHRRDALAALLWPETSDEVARRNLRITLHRLRQALHDTEQPSRVFNITRETLQIRQDAVWVDARAFEAHLSHAREHHHPRAEHCSTCAEHLARAIALYRGSFLEGFFLKDSLPFAEWALLHRERLHHLVIGALYDLTEYHRRRGELDKAEQYARRQVELEPWREEAHLQLMDILARQGEISAALRQYEICRHTLAQELALEPSLEAQRLYERIQRLRQHVRPRLPQKAGPFIGREEELARIASLLSSPDVRLLTILGPPGAGKTRLALEAAQVNAHLFLDGVYFVPLVEGRTAEDMATAVAQAVRLPLKGHLPPEQQLVRHLQQMEILLVLDNIEHLLPARQNSSGPAHVFLTTLLEHTQAVKLLVTSRRRLNLRSEWVVPIDGLPYPPSPFSASSPPPSPPRAISNPHSPPSLLHPLTTFPAPRLFITRARQAHPHFSPEREAQAVLRICQLVEGLPLAIELAAAATSRLTCNELAARLEDNNLDLLHTPFPDIPPRHRSLRAVFEHTWRLLSPAEQDALAKLSVFRGTFSAAAAWAITGTSDALLTALLDQSLVQRTEEGRYSIHEFLREYAHEKLQARPHLAHEIHQRHARYFAHLLAQHKPHLEGSHPAPALDAIEQDLGNVRVAWEWAVQQGDEEIIDQAEEGLYLFLEMRGFFQEGRNAFTRALDILSSHGKDIAPHLMARLLLREGWFAWRLAQYEHGREILQRGLALARTHGTPEDVIFGLGVLGLTLHNMGEEKAAETCYREGLALTRSVGNARATMRMLCRLGLLRYSVGDYETARALFEEAYALAKHIGGERATAFAQAYLGLAYGEVGAHTRACTYCEDALAQFQAIKDEYGIALCHAYLGRIHTLQGDYDKALRHLRTSIDGFRKLGDDHATAYALEKLGDLHCTRGEYKDAQTAYRKSLSLYRKVGNRGSISRTLGLLGYVMFRQGNRYEAKRLLRERKIYRPGPRP